MVIQKSNFKECGISENLRLITNISQKIVNYRFIIFAFRTGIKRWASKP